MSLLRFSLVFVTGLGFADAVLSLPVQNLLELLLLPAHTVTHQHDIPNKEQDLEKYFRFLCMILKLPF